QHQAFERTSHLVVSPSLLKNKALSPVFPAVLPGYRGLGKGSGGIVALHSYSPSASGNTDIQPLIDSIRRIAKLVGKRDAVCQRGEAACATAWARPSRVRSLADRLPWRPAIRHGAGRLVRDRGLA